MHRRPQPDLTHTPPWWPRAQHLTKAQVQMTQEQDQCSRYSAGQCAGPAHDALQEIAAPAESVCPYIHTQYTSTLMLQGKRKQQCETQTCKPSFLTAGKLRRSRTLTHIQIHIHNAIPLVHTLILCDSPVHTHRASQAAVSAALGQMPSWMLSVY